MKIGIDLGGTNIRAGLVDDAGKVVERHRVATPAKEAPEKAVEVIAGLCRKFSGAVSIGLGAPGLIDAINGVVRTSPNLPQWNSVPVGKMLAQAVGLPVTLANDVNAIAWGEFLFGAGRGAGDQLCITLGTGLGGALIIDGKLHLGKDQTAGEIGHFTLIPDGHPCPCGNRGCLEQYVAKNAIVRRAQSLRPDIEGHTPETVAQAAGAGEEWARSVYEAVGVSLGQILGGMIQVLNLDRIIVGGQIAGAGEPLFGPLRASTARNVYPLLRESYSIVKGKLGNDAGIIGAAFL